MLPFHKRARVNSSIEILTEDLEPVELPAVRPPSIRPPSVRPAAGSPYYYASMPSPTSPPPKPSRPAISFSSFGDDECTIVRPDKRPSSAPPAPSSRDFREYDRDPRNDLRMPRIPPSFVPRFDDDAPTQLHTSLQRARHNDEQPVLSMSTPPSSRGRFVDESPSSSSHWVPPPPPSVATAEIEDAPRSTAAVDANASAGRAVDLSMTSSLSGVTDLRNLRRPNMAWAAGLVAVGVFAGLVAAFVARGEGLAAAAALVDPSSSSSSSSQAVTADVAKAAAAAPRAVEAAAPVAVALRPGAAVAAVAAVAPPQPQQGQAQAAQATAQPAAPSCAVDAVTPVAVAAQAAPPVALPVVVAAAPVAVAKPAPAAPRVVVHHAAPPAPRVEHAPVQVAERAPAPPPVAKHSRHSSGRDDLESASAADALAKAQLDAALSR